MAQPINHVNTGGTDGTPSKAGLSSGLIATLSGGALLLVFILQNRSDVTLKFLLWSFIWPMAA